jgi:glutaredoxin-like protein NrdH
VIDFTVVEGNRNVGDIRVFALSTCGWCKKTKNFFAEHGIRFSYIDVDRLLGDELARAKAEQLKYNPRGSFPTIVVDGQESIAGYDEQRLLDLIGER